MPNPPKPIVPNITTGAATGRVATDRYDFQAHLDGTDFRQKADTIDLFPTIVIGSEITNVQDAIVALKDALTIPILPDATSSVKGVLKLTNDLGGTADLPSVVALRGFPINSTPPTTGNVLTWNGSAWAPASIAGSFTLGGDVTGSAAANTIAAIKGRPVSANVPVANNGLIWTGSAWTPIHTIPLGTGFATTTSGAVDTNATANIRYSGGKFQTDVNIQFKNSSILGDLAWAPTSTNKTLTLPDITDTLVARTTTDTLTNKTINATNNTITDTSTVSGDILVSNGTKFVRRAQGSDGTFWGVSGGVAGYFTPPTGSIGVTGTGFVTVTSGVVDAAATANVRYTGGKLQSDTSIQWKNSSITGDLSWLPTASNKTLSLPDATDTLVARNTTDVLTNKTFDVSSNNLTDTSQAAGDLLKNDGSKFVRFAMGTSLQVLRVNSGGTDLEWATSSISSSGSSGTIQISDGAGGFSGATNVLAGSGFISAGVTPSTVGLFRTPYSASATLFSTKDSGGTDREIISQSGANLIRIGPATSNSMNYEFFGGNIDMKPATQWRVYCPSGTNPSITASGAGQVVLNPDGFDGFQVNVNGSANAAISSFFGGVSGLGSGDSKYIAIGNSASPPSATPSGGGYMYVETGALKYRGSSGTLTTVGPADPHCKKCGRDFMHEWENPTYGKLATCVPCLLDALQILGINVDSFSDRRLNS